MHQFKGPGQRLRPLIIFEGINPLANYIDSDTASSVTDGFTNIAMRFFAGDLSLIGDIFENNPSNDNVDIVIPTNDGRRVSIRSEMPLVSQSVAKVDSSGNNIISLQGIGIASTVRYTRIDDIMKFSELDAVMGLTGHSNTVSGKYFCFL